MYIYVHITRLFKDPGCWSIYWDSYATEKKVSMRDAQPVLVFLLSTLSMHLFAWMVVYFIFFRVSYIFFFDETLKSKSICLDITVWYPTKISAVYVRLFFKIVFFSLLFQKGLWLVAHFYVVPEVEDFGHIYTSLVAQSQFWQLLMKQQQGVYICHWLLECMYSGFAQGTGRMYYILAKGSKIYITGHLIFFNLRVQCSVLHYCSVPCLIDKDTIRESIRTIRFGVRNGKGKVRVDIITDLVSQIIIEGIIPVEWEPSIFVNCYKRERVALERGNYGDYY